MNNLLIAQSGGPTAAINATLVGILQYSQLSGNIANIYGARYGIEGVIKDQIIELNGLLGDSQRMDLLMHTPASALGTCRYRLPDLCDDEAPYKKILEIFEQYSIKYFIYIGGNDSMDTVDKLSEYCKQNNKKISIIGAPKTIDNDLFATDHCPGFGSAAKYIATTISEIACDISSYNVPSVTIVEIMGRNAGWLTASAVLARLNGGAGADLIYLCEREFNNDVFIQDVKEKMEQKKAVLIAVSEGIKYSNGAYVSDSVSTGEVDNFGHKYIEGAARVLEKLVRTEIGCKVRSINLNLMQRAAAHLTSVTDIVESRMLGQKALDSAIKGETGKMVAINRISDHPYRIEYISVPVKEVANKEKIVPLSWITKDGRYVTNAMMEYLLPLIQGESKVPFEKGITKHFTIY